MVVDYTYKVKFTPEVFRVTNTYGEYSKDKVYDVIEYRVDPSGNLEDADDVFFKIKDDNGAICWERDDYFEEVE